jgi:hypothetical protein
MAFGHRPREFPTDKRQHLQNAAEREGYILFRAERDHAS